MDKLHTVHEVLCDMKKGVYDFTVDDQCSNCGNCCSNFIPIGKHEIKRIQDYIKQHQIKEQVRRYPTAQGMIDMVCPFRSESEKKCTIYPVRPAICRDFRCDKPSKDIWASKDMYHGKFDVVDMRAQFFGGDTRLGDFLKMLFNG